MLGCRYRGHFPCKHSELFLILKMLRVFSGPTIKSISSMVSIRRYQTTLNDYFSLLFTNILKNIGKNLALKLVLSIDCNEQKIAAAIQSIARYYIGTAVWIQCIRPRKFTAFRWNSFDFWHCWLSIDSASLKALQIWNFDHQLLIGPHSVRPAISSVQTVLSHIAVWISPADSQYRTISRPSGRL